MNTGSDTFANEVLKLTNQFRAKNNLPPLKSNGELTQTAQTYSETMARQDFFSHTGKDGSKPWDRAKDAGYTARYMGENIAAGYQSPAQVVEGWINSPGHRANLLNSNFTELGVGYFLLENDTGSVNYKRYWTQVFGSGDLTPSAALTNQQNSSGQNASEQNASNSSGLIPEPVAELSFEKIINNIAADTSTDGGNNKGRLYGDVSPTNGKVGKAVAFDGSGDVITLQNSQDINLGVHAERTVAMWFTVDEAAADSKQVIYEEGGQSRGLNAYVEDDLLYFGGWNTPESNWSGSWISTDKVEVGKWHHLTLVLDGKETVQNGAITAYLDGDKVGQMKGSQLWGHGDRIGLGNVNQTTKFHDGFGSHKGHGLAGAIDELQIFNSALSANQVQQLADVG
ncbi:MAG: CAP domain-containing protein [Phormidesmis sp.]